MKNFLKICLATAAMIALAVVPLSAKTVAHNSQAYTFTAAPSTTNSQVGSASEVITFNPLFNVTNGDTITIGAGLVGRATYTFTNATGSNIPIYCVQIGPNAENSCSNLFYAITANSASNGYSYGSNTPVNALVTATQSATNTITITAASAYAGTKGNTISVTAQSISNDIVLPYNQTTLAGGYETAVAFVPGMFGVSASISYTTTNAAAATNQLTLTFGVSGVKSNLVGSAAANVTPALNVAITQTAAGTGSVFTNWPALPPSYPLISMNSTSSTTNIFAPNVGSASWVALTQIANNSTTNTVTGNVVFSWSEDDGK